MYHLQKAHPDAGEFRIWSLLAREDISVRTVGRVMALNRQVYDDIPHQRKHAAKQPRSRSRIKPPARINTGSLTDG